MPISSSTESGGSIFERIGNAFRGYPELPALLPAGEGTISGLPFQGL